VTVGGEVALGNHLAVVGGRLVHPGLGSSGQWRRGATVLGVEVLGGLAVGEISRRGDLVGALLSRGDQLGVPRQVREALSLASLVLDIDALLLVGQESGGGRDDAESGCQSRGNGETHNDGIVCL